MRALYSTEVFDVFKLKWSDFSMITPLGPLRTILQNYKYLNFTFEFCNCCKTILKFYI